jgi:hypothetical protein
MSKKTSKRSPPEEDDFISHQAMPFRRRLRLPRESSYINTTLHPIQHFGSSDVGCDEKALIRRVKGFTAETACALNGWERMRRRLAPGGLRLRFWRRALDYHARAERVWTWS